MRNLTSDFGQTPWMGSTRTNHPSLAGSGSRDIPVAPMSCRLGGVERRLLEPYGCTLGGNSNTADKEH